METVGPETPRASANEVQAGGRRIVSLDAFRGLTMFLLVAEGAGVYEALLQPELSAFKPVFEQFTHHPWHGLRFWDLVQPYFMFIVGVAMPFSIGRRREKGESESTILRHVAYRSFVLFFLGVMLHCTYSNQVVWELWNVLTQLAFTYPVAYLLMGRPARLQIGVSLGLILAMEVVYRVWAVPGFDQPFVKGHNFGAWMDMFLMGKTSPGGWVAINCVATAAHTIWGVVAGQLLRSKAPEAGKLGRLVGFGVLAIIAGYALDPITPIIKRICTSSFVLVSGGWCLVTLAGFYYVIDQKGRSKWARFAMIVGMNSIFIYLFSRTIGPKWLNGFVDIFAEGVCGWMGAPAAEVISAFAALGIQWYLCYWLYKRKAFIKL